MKSFSRVWLFATSWTAAYQAPSSMGFSRQEYWSGVPLPSPILKYMKIKKIENAKLKVQEYFCASFGKWSFKTKLIKCSNIVLLMLRYFPTPVFLPGKSHGQRSLVGCSPWGCEESDTIEQLHFHFSLSCIGERNGNPLQCSCLENPRDGSLVGCRLWSHTESDTTEVT